ncbi:hypothetical protein ACE38W_02720 [Chitinophaga sp. Hz27]|uniref:hypothetical protein n=1 Tax=Chitinophaga sp. Hz27 TaxID=3347169 RepID=UPI0035E0669E
MRRSYIYIVALMLLTGMPGHVWSQALDQLGVKKGITMSGSLNTSATAYSASGIENRRDPLAWYFNGNLNINMFGYDMPFTFSYSNQGSNYSQPFNQFRFAPSYKWARAYFGTTSMNFSNYTLAGHMFDGAGVELSPGKWRMSAMYGRLLKAVQFDVLHPENYSRAAFERNGYGLKLGYENNGDAYGISIFRAKDKMGSLEFIPADATITPKENVAVSFNLRKTIFKRFFTDIEYAVSALNRDTRAIKGSDSTVRSGHNFLGNLLSSTGTTSYFDAIQAGLGYSGSFYSIQLRYERVAPEYETLGAYTVVNDMRNITIAPTVTLFKGKVNLSGNAGMQVNNLDHTRASDDKRFVGTFNVAVVPNEHWAVNGSYSNFSNYTRMRPQVDPYFNNAMDTLDFYQVNNSYNGTVMYRTGSKEHQHTIMLNSSYQYANNNSTAKDAVPNLSKFFTSAVNYNYNIQPKNLSLTGGVNYYNNNATGVQTTFLGPTMNVSKQYLDKTFRTAVMATYNVTQATTTATSGETKTASSSLFNSGLNLNYTPKGKKTETVTSSGKRKLFSRKAGHNIGLSVIWLMRGATESQQAYSELTSTINYTYSF